MELEYTRGDYLSENSHETVRGKVVLDRADNFPGMGKAYRLAEKAVSGEHEGKWFSYWQPASQLHDEIALDACEHTNTLDADQVDEVEEKLAECQPDFSGVSDRMTPVDETVTRVKDVMPEFTDYFNVEDN